MQPFVLPDCPGDETSVALIELLLAHTPAPFSREQFGPGHITATGLVIEYGTGRMAMVLHGRLGRWLLPGGHIEVGDETIEAAAAREVLEETGLAVGKGTIAGADVHGIPPGKGEPYHLHHDVLVAFTAVPQALVLSDESQAVRWVSPAEFDAYGVPANVRRAYARIAARAEQ
jgi:8-oxo-dGTP pyrophosphatase MutT (NUDIX family)